MNIFVSKNDMKYLKGQIGSIGIKFKTNKWSLKVLVASWEIRHFFAIDRARAIKNIVNFVISSMIMGKRQSISNFVGKS